MSAIIRLRRSTERARVSGHISNDSRNKLVRTIRGAFVCGAMITLSCSADTGSPRATGSGGANGTGTGGSGAGMTYYYPDGGIAGAGGTPMFIGGGGSSAAGALNTGAYAGNYDAGVECIDQAPQPIPPPTPITTNDCPGSLDAATVQSLQQGGSGSGVRILYPYDGTIFPRGLPAPLLQWEQTTSADAVYIHMKSGLYEYFGCFGPNADKRLQIPQSVWNDAGKLTQGGSDPMTVELTIKSGGTIIGPITQTWTIAVGKLQGALFYNTYTSPQAGNNGAVMRLHLGDSSPQVFMTDTGLSPSGPCWSCHSLSANGNVLVAQHHAYPFGPYTSASLDLTTTTPPLSGPNPPAMVILDGTTQTEMGLGAVYPDGSKVLTMGSPGDSTVQPLFPDGAGNVPGMIGPKLTKLLNTSNGTEIAMNGWNVQYAQMPSFSPDGTMVAFNWYENSNGHSLAVANFDSSTNTFSNVRVIYTNNTLFPGWPFITPDNKEVTFVLGNTADYVSAYPFMPAGRPLMASSDLWTVDIESGQARQLARANGYPQDGAATYLPRPGRDEHLIFFPTMSPVASGGYFWVFFTSRRTYGNLITQNWDDPDGFKAAATKKIWVSAYNIRTDGTPIADPSHPPFYLPGQEDAAGNIRAFAALEPCHQDGNTCETGVDCCTGQCSNGVCGPPPPPPPLCSPTAPPPPPPCAQIDERCTTDGDCCDDRATCVAGFCEVIEQPR